MHILIRPEAYPKDIAEQLQGNGQRMLEVANTWLSTWPRKVEALFRSEEYLDALNRQVYAPIDEPIGPPPDALPNRPLSDLPGTAGDLTFVLDSLDEHGQPEELRLIGMSESLFVERLPYAKGPKPDALYRHGYRYDTASSQWLPVEPDCT